MRIFISYILCSNSQVPPIWHRQRRVQIISRRVACIIFSEWFIVFLLVLYHYTYFAQTNLKWHLICTKIKAQEPIIVFTVNSWSSKNLSLAVKWLFFNDISLYFFIKLLQNPQNGSVFVLFRTKSAYFTQKQAIPADFPCRGQPYAFVSMPLNLVGHTSKPAGCWLFEGGSIYLE